MLAWCLRTFVMPPWAAHERSPYLRVAAQLERDRRLSLEARQERQWHALRAIVTHAWEESPFYRRRFDALGFQPGDLHSWEDLARLPLLTKQDVRDHGDEMVARSYPRPMLLPKRTSGSTGVSLRLLVDADCNQWRRGVTLYRDRWTGWDLGDWRAAIWGNPPETRSVRQRLRSALLDRTLYLDTLRMDESMMDDFARAVRARRPTLLWGHAHSLYLFARWWETRDLPRPRLAGILSTAMVLHPHERRTIESVFATRVFDRYGCEEVSLIASECEAHEGLHVNTDSLVVEIVPRDGDSAGAVVVTDLQNRGMPFIRYDVADRAVVRTRPCSCGRTYPLLETVTGRVADYLFTPRGQLVSGISLTENFATLIPGIRQAQIVQDRLTHLIVRVVPEPGLEAEIRPATAALVRERFGADMTSTLEFVDRIEQERSGKYRFTICAIPESERPRPSDATGLEA